MASSSRTGFSDRIKQDLSRLEIGSDREARAELAALLRFAGGIHLTGGEAGGLSIQVHTASGAVARRTHALLTRLHGLRPQLRVRAPGGVRTRSEYAVVVHERAREVGADAGLLDDDGRPTGGVPWPLVDTDATAVAYLRGLVLAVGSVSAPQRAPHLELVIGSDEVAHDVAGVLRRIVDAHVGVSPGRAGARVVIKSGEAIGVLLARLGATGAYLDWDERRLLRSLRDQANRISNADAANLRRSVDAAADQIHAVETAIAHAGWDELGPDTREVALARLANPEASLTELGELCDPPIGKSAVYRRLQRIVALAERAGRDGASEGR